MSFFFKLLGRILTAFSILALAPAQSHGQGVPWYTITLPIPNGFVDVSTGNLHLEIPVGPQDPNRNGETNIGKLVYDSNGVGFGSLSSGVVSGAGWSSQGSIHSGTGGVNGQTSSYPTGYPFGQIVNYSSVFFTDNHSTTHSANINTQQVNCNTGPPSNIPYPGNPGSPSTASGGASDASGYLFFVTNYNKITVYSPDGWIVYDTAKGLPYPMDLNGNYGSSQPNTSLSTTGIYCPYPPPLPWPPSNTSKTTYTTSSGSQVSTTLSCQTLKVTDGADLPPSFAHGIIRHSKLLT